MVPSFFTRTLSVLLLSFLLAASVEAGTKVLGEGEILLLSNAKKTQFGALKILDIDRDKSSVSYRWYLPPENAVDLSAPDVVSGTVATAQVRGRAVIAYGPFVLEWHGGAGKKGILSANGILGVRPLLFASSAIDSVTRIRDARSGFKYEIATERESADPLGIIESFSKLPKARIGIGVAETFADVGYGTEELVVQVTGVDPDSNAYKAGVRRSQIILSLQGYAILSAEEFRMSLKEIEPGAGVMLTVWQNRESKDLEFEAESRFTAPAAEAKPAPTVNPNLSPEERERVEANQRVRELMEQSLEALKASYYE